MKAILRAPGAALMGFNQMESTAVPVSLTVPQPRSMSMKRTLYVVYENPCEDGQHYTLYLDGRFICLLKDGMQAEFEIDDEAHAIQIRYRNIWPCWSAKIDRGIESWRLTGKKVSFLRRDGSVFPKFTAQRLRAYWVTVIPRETYANEAAAHSFTGRLALPQKENAQLPCVDGGQFFAAWNEACPFTESGEKWVCFEEKEKIPLATVQRTSASQYQISYVGGNGINPLSAINMIQISNAPVPVPDVHRGCWFAELPEPLRVGLTHAYIFVEYINQTMHWQYYSVVYEEHGMQHYEVVDAPFERCTEHGENEFSSREQLMQCLIDFIPRFPDNHIDSVPDLQHICISTDKLRELIAPFFR